MPVKMRKLSKQFTYSQEGFTLIEVLVVKPLLYPYISEESYCEQYKSISNDDCQSRIWLV
jgi:hypothetical protein